MRTILFPFGQIDKNLRIVLYAAGAVGKAYYCQLQRTEYLDIVLWVDKKPQCKDVVFPAELAALRADAYDFVLIAVEHTKIANEIKCELIGLGIDESKIIYLKPIVCSAWELWGQQSEFSLALLLSGDFETINTALEDYFVIANGDIYYFSKLIKEAAQSNTQCREGICNEVVAQINRFEMSPKHALVLLRILFEADCFNSQALQLYVKNASLLDSETSQQYWAFLDIVIMWFLRPKALYDKFFLELRELASKITEGWKLEWGTTQYECKENKKICLIFPYLTPGVLPTYLSPIVAQLVGRDYKVHILGIDYNYYDGGVDFLKPIYPSIKSDCTWNDSVRECFPDGVIYHYANVRNVKERQERILSLISAINPLCVLDATRELGIINYYIHKKYPVINVPLRKMGHSCSHFHKILISNNEDEMYPPFTEPQAIRLCPAYVKKEPIRIFARSKYEFMDDDVVCVTVGDRLFYDLSANLFDSMCAVMSANKKIKWLIVGAETLPCVTHNDSDLIEECIRFIGYEPDLAGLYQICDIYINPSRVGGGTTIAWAAQAGLAVVTPKDASAGLEILGKSVCVGSEADIAPKVAELAANPEMLAAEKTAMRELSSNWSIVQFVDKLETEMLLLAEGFARGEYNREL